MTPAEVGEAFAQRWRLDSEFRARMSAINRANALRRWQNPEYRERQIALCCEGRARARAQRNGRWRAVY